MMSGRSGGGAADVRGVRERRCLLQIRRAVVVVVVVVVLVRPVEPRPAVNV